MAAEKRRPPAAMAIRDESPAAIPTTELTRARAAQRDMPTAQ
jgi:hypothetical protein